MPRRVWRPRVAASQKKKRDYKREYAKFWSRPAAKKKTVERTKLRRRLTREGVVSKWDGKQIHHKWNKVIKVMPASKNMGMKEASRIKWSKRNKAWWWL